MAKNIQIRRDTAANWAAVNPTLAQGEIGIETDLLGSSGVLQKYGDGVTPWNLLPYQDRGGIDGLPGKSAYQVWLDEGNTGTEQDFLDSLEGPQGPIGQTGNQGNPGPEGPVGPEGEGVISGIGVLSDAPNVILDVGTNRNNSLLLVGNRILDAPTNSIPGYSGQVFLTQDATGFHALTLDPKFNVVSGSVAEIALLGPNQKVLITWVSETINIFHTIITPLQ